MRAVAPLAAACLFATACGRLGFEAGTDGGPTADGAADGQTPSDAASRTLTFEQVEGDFDYGATTVTVPFAEAVAAGNALVVMVDLQLDAGPATLTSVTDTRGTSYSVRGPFDGEGIRTYVAFGRAPTGGANSVTAAASTVVPGYLEVRILEYSGVTTTFELDDIAAGAGTAIGQDSVVTAPLTTRAANELLVGLAVYGGAGSVGTGWRLRSGLVGDVLADKIAPTAGEYQGVASADGTSSGWNIVAAAFYAQ